MTPRERVAGALKGEKPDKLPIMVANSNTFICRYYGMTVEQFLSDPERCAEGNIRFTQDFEIDYNLCVNGYILYGCGPEIGCEWKYAGKDFPGFINGPLKCREDLDKLMIPDAPSGYFAHYLEVTQRVCDTLGDRYHLSVSILGPFAVGCFLRGIQEVMLDTLADPDFFRCYMEVCNEFSIYFGRQILKINNIKPILNEIFLTPEMVRPDTFHELIAPNDKRVQDVLGPSNAPNSLAAFMGRPGDSESQKGGRDLYKAFFNGVDSVTQLENVLSHSLPGLPFPAAISGLALDSKSSEELVNYLRSVLDFLVREQGRYPAILLTSVQADSREKAKAIAQKIEMIKKLRDEYQL
jgi:hypothetical protein